MNNLSIVKEYYSEYVEPRYGAPKGASEMEVRLLERNIGYSLPGSYREYLLWMGKDYNGIFKGSQWFIDDVIGNNELLPELLEENHVEFNLPEKYIVFFTHQGYMAGWFDLLSTEADPMSWFFSESNSIAVPRVEGPFSCFLLNDIKGLVQISNR